jgi:ankyrin repeat protein
MFGGFSSIRFFNLPRILHDLLPLLGNQYEPTDTALIDLLAHCANVGDANIDGNNPFNLAARNLQHTEDVLFLLSRGVDVSAKNSKGNTPLHEAAVDGGVFLLNR